MIANVIGYLTKQFQGCAPDGDILINFQKADRKQNHIAACFRCARIVSKFLRPVKTRLSRSLHDQGARIQGDFFCC